jgi:hypothetical protein
VAHDDLPVQPQPAHDEAVLAVAVGGLVQVHEVHVNRGPGQVAVELGVQVGQGLAQAFRPLIHILDGENVWHQ